MLQQRLEVRVEPPGRNRPDADFCAIYFHGQSQEGFGREKLQMANGRHVAEQYLVRSQSGWWVILIWTVGAQRAELKGHNLRIEMVGSVLKYKLVSQQRLSVTSNGAWYTWVDMVHRQRAALAPG